ncbi:type II toxin-antitoxin system RelE/ParE family toxin [Bradyrhizobium canariense]|uniref:Addiction module toxin RelE n=1 Tax=Bradyrhizobium canariense TaxID=255045 RepID=A0A1X3FQ99_9BRAD|nr:type II toxin-antitoxin system RelE/ParE family toxin [Bradyrhizobium canariense]OSI68899.1 addiction module toxin RelE [Bradyrhizobium canariense]OSI79389.1 addiction module toxin RelE [Bradyrhizobium canariense]OSI89613.1 addiction module toxin RelE [Bradyrhizobium canariense]OSI91009.1 addiction module toxin RelE [Bradyrhizobium canariense]OSJ03979.1 addiction module toxin RelE [Bradyrhizobium canariense]
MHTVARSKSFDTAAKQAELSEDEIFDLVTYLAENPLAGDEIGGTGGCRKLRVAGRGKGKRGGFRTITFYSGETMPVFLLTVFAKGEKSTLTAKEAAGLKTLTGMLVEEYKKRISSFTAKPNRSA